MMFSHYFLFSTFYFLGCRRRSGQAALVVILVALVGLTVVVAVLSRSVTTLNLSTRESDRSRAFSAAEAGIEDALRRDLAAITVGGPFTIGGAGESEVSYTVTKLTTLAATVDQGDVVTVDWTKSGATSATVTWDSCADLVGTEVKVNGGNVDVVHSAELLATSKTYFEGATGNLLRLRFTGCSTAVTVVGADGDGTLSFYDVLATGTSGQATSAVKVSRSEPAPISLLDFAVFSGGGVN